MLCCTEIVKQNGEYQFTKKLTDNAYGALKDVINHLFSGYQSEIRAIAVCTKDLTEVPDEKEFQSLLCVGDREAVILRQGKEIPKGTVGCARLEPCDCLGQALKEMISRIGEAVGDTYIIQDAKTAVSIYCGYDDLIKKVDLHTEWSRDIAERASQVLRTDKLKEETGRVPNICVLLILSEAFFKIFMQEGCYFPLFIEYVVHAVDATHACKMLGTKLQERDKQLEEKDQIIEEQTRLIGRDKNEPVTLQSRIDENNASQTSDTTRPMTPAPPETKTQRHPETAEVEIPTNAAKTG